VLFNQGGYGVTNYFSIGAGILPVFLFGGGATPVWITPKFSIPVVIDKFNVGAGALAGTVLGESGTRLWTGHACCSGSNFFCHTLAGSYNSFRKLLIPGILLLISRTFFSLISQISLIRTTIIDYRLPNTDYRLFQFQSFAY
jgi:hypothetical protein